MNPKKQLHGLPAFHQLPKVFMRDDGVVTQVTM